MNQNDYRKWNVGKGPKHTKSIIDTILLVCLIVLVMALCGNCGLIRRHEA